MATLPELTKEAGLDPVVCSHCGQRLSTTHVIHRLLELALARLVAGEPIKVRGFGSFTVGTYQPRGFAKEAGLRRVVRFHLTAGAKRLLNKGPTNE